MTTPVPYVTFTETALVVVLEWGAPAYAAICDLCGCLVGDRTAHRDGCAVVLGAVVDAGPGAEA